MEIRLGPAGIPMCCKGSSTKEGLKKISELGLNAMEVAFTHGIYMPVHEAEELGKFAKEIDVKLSVHAPYYINLASETQKIIEDSKKRIISSLERGVAMNAVVVNVHAGYYGKDKERSSGMIFEACREISDMIDSNGWDIKLGLETMGRQKSWGTLEEVIEVSKKLRNIVPCIDLAHLYARDGGQINFKEIFDKLEVLKLSKYHCHFSGIRYGLVGIGKGNEKNHVPLKEAGPDFEDFAKEVLNRDKDIAILSESPLLEIDSLLMKAIFEKLGYKF